MNRILKFAAWLLYCLLVVAPGPVVAPDRDSGQQISVAIVDQTAEVQRMCDRACQPGGSRVVDLGGRTWVVHCLRLGPQHNGLTIRNGTLFTTSDSTRTDKRYGIIELCKGITHRGVTYPDAPLSLSCDRVRFEGTWTSWTDDIETNRSRCQSQGLFCSGINALNGSRPDLIYCRNCTFTRLFAGINALGTHTLKAHYCDFRQIATPGVVSSIPAGNQVPMFHDLYLCNFDECGSAFDFSAPSSAANATTGPNCLARVLRCRVTNPLGRTKFHGPWSGLIQHSTFSINRAIPNRYASISFPAAREVTIEDCTMSGFVVGGIESSGWTARPTITIRRTRITGGQIAINSSAFTHLDGVTIEDCALPWGDSTIPASQIDTAIVTPAPADSLARKLIPLRRIVREWNALHGTSNNVENWWYLVPAVRAKVLEIESQMPETVESSEKE